MSTAYSSPVMPDLRDSLQRLRGSWGWFVLVGFCLIVLGAIALGSIVIASLATVLVLGALILVSGIAEMIGAFWCRGWSGFFLHLLSGVLSIVVGVLFLRAPVGGMLALTMLLACLLMVGGIFKIISAAAYRFSNWGWPLIGGFLDFVLGVLIWMEWPASALWVIGMFVGISFIFRGVSWMALGFSLRSLPRRTTTA